MEKAREREADTKVEKVIPREIVGGTPSHYPETGVSLELIPREIRGVTLSYYRKSWLETVVLTCSWREPLELGHFQIYSKRTSV